MHDVTKISDAMYKKFHTAFPQDYLFSVIQKMNSHPFDIIPIVNPKEGNVIGIVTNQTIMNLLTDSKTS